MEWNISSRGPCRYAPPPIHHLFFTFNPIVFLRTRVPDPLLSLTASITLRNKPLSRSPARSAIYRLLEGRADTNGDEPGSSTAPNGTQIARGDDGTGFFQEINLLGGRKDAPSFSEAESALDLPTTRIV